MNERIKLLAEQANCSIDGMGYGEGNIEKFAELIVRECAGITLDYKNGDYYNGWCDHSAEILEHFGVEE